MSSDDEVGYGRPPKAHQFRKGQSGNSRGRPRRNRPIHLRQVRTDFFAAAHKSVTLTVNGSPITMTRIQALYEVEFAQALGGNGAARKRLLDTYRTFSAEHEDWQVRFTELALRAEANEAEDERRRASQNKSGPS